MVLHWDATKEAYHETVDRYIADSGALGCGQSGRYADVHRDQAKCGRVQPAQLEPGASDIERNRDRADYL